MKLCHFDFSEPLAFRDNLAVLVVENVNKMYEYCNDFFMQQRGEEGNFIVIDGEKELSFKKNGVVVFDLFNLSLQDKKITNGLFSLLRRLADEKYTAEQWEIRCKMVALTERLGVECDYPIEFEEDFLFVDLFRSMKVQLKEDYNSLLEKVTSYIDALCAFTDVKLLVIVGLSAFLSQESFALFAEHVAYSALSVLLIEKNQFPFPTDKKTLIIDDDLCEILVN